MPVVMGEADTDDGTRLTGWHMMRRKKQDIGSSGSRGSGDGGGSCVLKVVMFLVIQSLDLARWQQQYWY